MKQPELQVMSSTEQRRVVIQAKSVVFFKDNGDK